MATRPLLLAALVVPTSNVDRICEVRIARNEILLVRPPVFEQERRKTDLHFREEEATSHTLKSGSPNRRKVVPKPLCLVVCKVRYMVSTYRF